MPRHYIPLLQILHYALDGAKTELGTGRGNLTDAEESILLNDIREIERRIKAINDKQEDCTL